MKIRNQYKVREMAGEHVVIMQGRCGADMTRIISLNATSLFLWNELAGRDFTAADVAEMLTSAYDVDAETAARDAEAWVGKLRSCNLVEE